jgi:tetratricopeptide (TPR) repeat protein
MRRDSSPRSSSQAPIWGKAHAKSRLRGNDTDRLGRRAENGVKLCRIGPAYFFGLMQALDELVARWRKNPDQEATLALCAHLGTSGEADLLREVGNTAEAWHRDNHTVMLSVGRMYLDAGLLAEAQSAFVQAGKLAATDSAAYRYLGEVLLRRGDAVRGEKTLARAITLGDSAPETRLWHERSVVYAALQQRKGASAVADEVARTAPHQASIPVPTLSPFDRPAEAAAPRATRRSRPPLAPARPSGPRRSSPPGMSRRRSASVPPAASARGAKSAPLQTLLMGRSPVPVPALDVPVHPPSPFFRSESHSPRPNHRARPASSASQVRRGDAGLSASEHVPEVARSPLFIPKAARAPAAPPTAEAVPPSDPFEGTFPDDPLFHDRLTLDEPASAVAPSSEPEAASDSWRPTAELDAHSAPSSASQPTPQAARTDPRAEPSPESVLLTLAQVGLYEADSGVVPAWESAPQPTPRRVWVMGGALLLAVGMGLGGYRYALGIQGQHLARAQELSTHLAGLLDSGSRTDLEASEADFQVLFELDSRGQEAAMLWLKNRVLHTLLEVPPVSGVESAIQRARTVGVEESRLIFGRLAGALSAGDLPGAGQIIEQWDQRAKTDALYQLLAGTVFERAGNPEALERYTSAVALQPDLKLAHVLAARLALLQIGPVAAKPTLDLAYARLGQSASAQVLRGLEWATSPASGAPAPNGLAPESEQQLPPFLSATMKAVAAVRADREGRLDEATAAYARALDPTTTPAMAAWIGYQALDAGHVDIARGAALKAVQLSVQHKSAQSLAARIALADDRLAEAQAAVLGLDPNGRDATLIEAVSAYENLQAKSTSRLLRGLSAEPAQNAALESLGNAEKVTTGLTRVTSDMLKRLGRATQVWGGLVATDAALDTGQLGLAEELAKAHGWDAERAAPAARLARLQRYQGQSEAALALVGTLLEHPSPRASSEAILTLLEAGRTAAAATAMERVGDASGRLQPWLRALVDAANGRQTGAQKELAGLTLPAKGEPVLVHAIALRALVAAKDRRAKAYASQLGQRFPAHPDVKAALHELGLRR